MNAKRAFFLTALALATLVVACTEDKKNQTLRPYSGPRDSGADGVVEESDATTDAVAIADSGVDAAEAAVVETFLSDLTFMEEGGYGPAEKDMSNGDIGAADGVTQMIAGVAYTKGIGTHSVSKLTWALGGQYKQFLANVGVDDETDGAAMGSVVFKVLVDGVEAYSSDMMTFNDAAKPVDVNVTNANTLELVVEDGGDGNGFDHADWANARLRK